MPEPEMTVFSSPRVIDALIAEHVFQKTLPNSVLPAYSTEIEPAWSVVTQMNSRGWRANICLYGDGRTIAQFAGHPGTWKTAIAFTTPMAICHVALITLGVLPE